MRSTGAGEYEAHICYRMFRFLPQADSVTFLVEETLDFFWFGKSYFEFKKSLVSRTICFTESEARRIGMGQKSLRTISFLLSKDSNVSMQKNVRPRSARSSPPQKSWNFPIFSIKNLFLLFTEVVGYGCPLSFFFLACIWNLCEKKSKGANYTTGGNNEPNNFGNFIKFCHWSIRWQTIWDNH